MGLSRCPRTLRALVFVHLGARVRRSASPAIEDEDDDGDNDADDPEDEDAEELFYLENQWSFWFDEAGKSSAMIELGSFNTVQVCAIS